MYSKEDRIEMAKDAETLIVLFTVIEALPKVSCYLGDRWRKIGKVRHRSVRLACPCPTSSTKRIVSSICFPIAILEARNFRESRHRHTHLLTLIVAPCQDLFAP